MYRKVRKQVDAKQSSIQMEEDHSEKTRTRSLWEPPGIVDQQNAEDEDFRQHHFEATGLELRQSKGAITAQEQGRLGVLQAKMDDYWAREKKRGSGSHHHIGNISIFPPEGRPETKIPPALAAGMGPIQKKNDTGLPDKLKTNVEHMSGESMDGVEVNYDSPEPARMQALAFTKGDVIHLGPGQESHLPHEAWHVAQQKQGRVGATRQLDGVGLNDNATLEKEADTMGEKAQSAAPPAESPQSAAGGSSSSGASSQGVVQRVIGPHMVGAAVVNTKTSLFYNVVAFDRGKYILKHRYGLDYPDERVDPDDPDYKVVKTPQQNRSSSQSQDEHQHDTKHELPQSSSHATTSSGSSLSRQRSVTESYYRGRKSEIEERWPALRQRAGRALQQLRGIVESEKQATGHDVFYNAAGLGAYTLHQIIKTIYEAHHGTRVRNFEFLRAPGTQVKDETRQGPRQFLESRGQHWSDHQDRPSLLSSNIALMGGVQDPSENTYDIMQSGGLFDVDPRRTVEIITTMLRELQVPRSTATQILQTVRELAEAVDKIKESQRGPKGKKESALYQILIPRQLTQRLVYIAAKNGLALDEELSFVNPEQVLRAIAQVGGSSAAWAERYLKAFEDMRPKEKAELLRGSEFTRYTLDAAQDPRFWKALAGRQDPQARILMHPQAFMRPGHIQVHTRLNMSEETQRTIQSGLRQIHRQASRHGAMGSDRSATTTTASSHQSQPSSSSSHGQDTRSPQPARRRPDRSELIQIIWDLVNESANLKRLITNGLPVIAGGRRENLDVDTPERMTETELINLYHFLNARR
ncbi:MAG: DUF4157 domain-containing protein [Acidobacteriota bacterium]|nr:DUF4157 domain-containing protein [Acidobacteriota bacterium]